MIDESPLKLNKIRGKKKLPYKTKSSSSWMNEIWNNSHKSTIIIQRVLKLTSQSLFVPRPEIW
jgi:hypothetical protein